MRKTIVVEENVSVFMCETICISVTDHYVSRIVNTKVYLKSSKSCM